MFTKFSSRSRTSMCHIYFMNQRYNSIDTKTITFINFSEMILSHVCYNDYFLFFLNKILCNLKNNLSKTLTSTTATFRRIVPTRNSMLFFFHLFSNILQFNLQIMLSYVTIAHRIEINYRIMKTTQFKILE